MTIRFLDNQPLHSDVVKVAIVQGNFVRPGQRTRHFRQSVYNILLVPFRLLGGFAATMNDVEIGWGQRQFCETKDVGSGQGTSIQSLIRAALLGNPEIRNKTCYEHLQKRILARSFATDLTPSLIGIYTNNDNVYSFCQVKSHITDLYTGENDFS